MEEKNQQLAEENSQLIAQIQTSGKTTGEQEKKYKALQEEYNTLDNRYKELQKILAGLESVAESAIKKIDGLFASSEKEI